LNPFKLPECNASPVVGLALGGGAARGIAHLGVILGLEELNVTVHKIAGVSSGALIGGLYAAGVSVSDMISKLYTLNWRSFASFHLSKRSMVSSVRVQALVESMIGRVTQSDCLIPFLVVVTNILRGEPTIFSSSNVQMGVLLRACVAFPGVYSPVSIDGQYYMDGGVFQNVPTEAVKVHGATSVIGVDVIPDIALDRLPNNAALIVDRSLDLMLLNQQRQASPPDILIRPVSVQISSFDIKSYDTLIELGYQSVIKNKHLFKHLL
jgi:NTE family protein